MTAAMEEGTCRANPHFPVFLNVTKSICFSVFQNLKTITYFKSFGQCKDAIRFPVKPAFELASGKVLNKL